MVVFENGAPAKTEYRKFRMRYVQGANDVASLQETLARRFRHAWRKPDLLLIDGGLAQVHAVEEVLRDLNLAFPVIGMAKGLERKRTDLICSQGNEELCRACESNLDLLTRVRDEAHRFAIAYHRSVRGRESMGKRVEGRE
jgi:excinuclease ABC subunit C